MNRFLALVSSLAMASAFAQSHTITRAGSQPSTAGPATNFNAANVAREVFKQKP